MVFVLIFSQITAGEVECILERIMDPFHLRTVPRNPSLIKTRWGLTVFLGTTGYEELLIKLILVQKLILSKIQGVKIQTLL